MAHRLRLARYPVDAYSPPAGVERPGQDLHKRLQGLIRRHLSPITATLLSEPQPSTDGRYIEWYTELAGQPVALPALPVNEQERARTLLQHRLAALRRLARDLSGTGSEAALGAALQQALAYPGDETVYVVDGQPVLTFWGYGSLPPEPVIPAPPAPEIPASALAGGIGPAGTPRWPRLSCGRPVMIRTRCWM